MKSRGFTLIELLVVISIIALLSSVVLASLNTARDKGKQAAGKQFEANLYHAAADYAVGTWDMTENTGTTLNDRSGNGNSGTMTNMATSSWSSDAPSGIGPSLFFDGVDDYVLVPNSASLQFTGDFSISVWVKPAASQKTYTDIVSKHAPGGFMIEQNGANQNQYYLAWDSNGSSSWVGQGVLTTLTANVWQHFTVVKSGTTLSHYVNGALTASGTVSSAFVNNALAMRIGDWSSSSGRQFSGYLDQFRIFNKGLTASEVGEMFAEGAAAHGLAQK